MQENYARIYLRFYYQVYLILYSHEQWNNKSGSSNFCVFSSNYLDKRKKHGHTSNNLVYNDGLSMGDWMKYLKCVRYGNMQGKIFIFLEERYGLAIETYSPYAGVSFLLDNQSGVKQRGTIN
jgi:hypothetical protein